MSMNLAFESRDGVLVDFPYQTTTDISYSAINAKSIGERYKIIYDDYIKRFDFNDKEEMEYFFEQMKWIRDKLEDENFELVVI